MRQAILVLAALGGLTHGAIAATVNVGPGQSIQSAINGVSDGDEIVAAPGTYHEAIDFAGKAIIVRSSGGPDVTTIDASGLASSVVSCKNSEGADTVLDGFTITGGEGTFWLSKTLGGGMYNKWTEPTVRNCIFLQNRADEGGGMYSIGQDPTITDCAFIGNTSTLQGLGGAGLFGKLSDPTLTNCRFIDNNAATCGGGVYTLNGNPSLVNCIFYDNFGFFGAGAYFANGNATLANCTFSGNTATVLGGAFRTIESITLADNCIFWGNGPDEINVDTSAVVTVNHCDLMGGWSGPGTSNNDSDPMFVDPANGDYRLGEGSPCIDAGDNAAVPAGVDTDLDGNERIVTMVDLGPYESQGGSTDPCPWDDDGDGTVGFGDLAALLNAWGFSAEGALDFDGDGTVGLADLTTLLANWGPCA